MHCLALSVLLPVVTVADCLRAQEPAQQAAPPSRLRLLVLNKGEATASILDAGTRKEVALVPVGDGPHEVAVAPDGRTAVVCNYGGQQPGHTLTVIDVERGVALRTIDLLQPGSGSGDGDGAAAPKRFLRPHGVEFLDATRVVVTSEMQRRLLVVDVGEGKVQRALPTAQPTLHMVALAADRRTAFGTSIKDGTLGVFDLAAGDAKPATVVATGAGAEGLAVRPGTTEVWVGNRAADTLAVFDAARGEVVATLPTADFPIRVACTPDGAFALVSCAEAGQVQVFDCRKRELAGTIDLLADKTELSPLPVGIRVEPDGARAWVACMRGEFLAVLDLRTRTLIDRVPARHGPDGMAFSLLPLAPTAGQAAK